MRDEPNVGLRRLARPSLTPPKALANAAVLGLYAVFMGDYLSRKDGNPKPEARRRDDFAFFASAVGDCCLMQTVQCAGIFARPTQACDIF